MLGELAEQFGELVFEEPLLALAGVDPSEEDAELARLVGEGPIEVDEAAHWAKRDINALTSGFFSSIGGD